MTDADREWFHAFAVWYETGDQDQILALLRDNVTLSAANSAFLADVLAGAIPRPTAKLQGKYVANERGIDEEIARLSAAGLSDEAIREHLIQHKWVKADYFRHVKRVTERRRRIAERGIPEGPLTDFAATYEMRTGTKL